MHHEFPVTPCGRPKRGDSILSKSCSPGVRSESVVFECRLSFRESSVLAYFYGADDDTYFPPVPSSAQHRNEPITLATVRISELRSMLGLESIR